MGRKRQRKSGNINNAEIGDKRSRQISDDDDFVSYDMLGQEQAATMRLNLVKEKRSNEANEEDSNNEVEFGVFPMLACRTNPQVMVNTIEKMNNIQKREIIDMGFGHMLSLRVKEVPSMLGYWLIDNFNPITCEISLQDGRKLHIEHNDVYRVFGFPKGKRIIKKKKKQEHHELLNEWKKFFPGKEHKILPVDVSNEALRHIDGGIWFRRQFMILLTICLIENGSNGYVTPQIMRCFEDVSQLVE
ncbi:uncharacterized protein LOC130999094 [Salvia miltiorrhiza]|uniref:uncharacterized protein LOC130999094 n=1 Tax=Salvia miltiorrhiza TaxID=226208 RepID=UPI0025AC4EA4|nr:uncharacterized protein LOC130999094 [Salvia miltiorrhiza]